MELDPADPPPRRAPVLLIVRASMIPDYAPEDALEDPLASSGDFRVITAVALSHDG